jgi:undecaprenyl-diphosphatase
MIEYLQGIDASVFTFLNGMHDGYFDNFMWLISNKLSWIIMIIALLYVLYRKGMKQLVLVVLAIALVILLSDQISSSIIKPIVERLRPSRNLALASTIHLVNGYRGGMYGFVSSHAANSFGVAVLLCLMLRRWYSTVALLIWASLVSYCRIYLGVHYPGDILCGAIVGCLMALLVYWLWKKIEDKKFIGSDEIFFDRDAKLLTAVTYCNLALLAFAAIFYSFTM